MRKPRPPLDFLSAYGRLVAGLARALRELVLEEAPDAIEKVYRNHPSAVWFGSGPKMQDMFCYIATSKSHVNLGFCRGAWLSDPSHVLEGEGKMMRHVKFRSQRDVERPFVRLYIRAAMEQIEQPVVESLKQENGWRHSGTSFASRMPFRRSTVSSTK
jgi:hypothetical protein